jgi:hypothetical protein
MLVVRGQSGKKKERISSQPWARTMISAREGISFLEGGRIATENLVGADEGCECGHFSLSKSRSGRKEIENSPDQNVSVNVLGI